MPKAILGSGVKMHSIKPAKFPDDTPRADVHWVDGFIVCDEINDNDDVSPQGGGDGMTSRSQRRGRWGGERSVSVLPFSWRSI